MNRCSDEKPEDKQKGDGRNVRLAVTVTGLLLLVGQILLVSALMHQT